MSGITQDQGTDIDNDAIQIEGGTDQTRIGNVSDSFKVNVTNAVSLSGIPLADVKYSSLNFLNGSSKDMAVNGSVTNVTFSVAPSASQTLYVLNMKIYLSDVGNLSETDFGAIASGLTNGVRITSNVDGSDLEFYNLMTNMDLYDAFEVLPQRSNWLGVKNFTGIQRFAPAIKLDGSAGDNMKFTIRDNLTGLNQFRASLLTFEVL